MKKLLNLTFGKIIGCVIILVLTSGNIKAQTNNYLNGFETGVGNDDWIDATRVASGTNGIISATGIWHAEVYIDGGFTRFGHVGGGSYNPVFPCNGYKTSLDIYLDVNGGWANDTRFDYSSAINGTNGLHRRDNVFNVGFYNDGTGPGAPANRFIISASNSTGRGNSFPKNPGRSPQAILISGWYTFEHSFRNNGGVLAVDYTIYDASHIAVATWTLSDPSDIIGTTVGGSRYGWLLENELSFLAIDNSRLILGDPLGGTASGNQTICSGSQPAGLALTGYNGTIQWQSSTDNVNFTNISGATAPTLTSSQMGVLTMITYYRAGVTIISCGTVYSNTVTIN